MTNEFLGWCWIGLLLVGLGLMVFARATRLRGARIFCPGPPPAWLPILFNPVRWISRSGCAYNLTGLPARDHGLLRCPECGYVSAPESRWRPGRNWRPAVVGTLALAGAVACYAVPWINTGNSRRPIPTLALTATEFLHTRQPRAFRDELGSRVCNGEVDKLSARVLALALTADLRDDNIHWNGERAADLLGQLWPDSRPALERALVDHDRQARMIAANVLRNRCPDDPSDTLLAACIEDLCDDGDATPYWTTCNARDAAEFLCRFPVRIESLLITAMKSTDAQQRRMAAAIAGLTHLESLMARAAPILVNEIRDDDIPQNACLAAPALYHFGPAVIPYLLPVCQSDDWQQREIARAIVERLEHPERGLQQLGARVPRITGLTDDPLRQLGAYPESVFYQSGP